MIIHREGFIFLHDYCFETSGTWFLFLVHTYGSSGIPAVSDICVLRLSVANIVFMAKARVCRSTSQDCLLYMYLPQL